MPGITVRLTNGIYELIHTEAKLEQVGMTAYMREAALMRAWHAYATRTNTDHHAVTEIRAWLHSQDRRHT